LFDSKAKGGLTTNVTYVAQGGKQTNLQGGSQKLLLTTKESSIFSGPPCRIT